MRWRQILSVGFAIGCLVVGPSQKASRAQLQPAGRQPALAATVDIGGTAGGAQLGDVDGDGSTDAVTVRGGRIVVVSAAGKTIFDRFVGATDVVAIRDLDGDGRAEVLFINRAIRSLEALDVSSGTVRWRYLFASPVDIAAEYVRVADLNSSRPGLETVVFPDYSHSLGDAYGYFLTSSGELYARPLIKNVNGNQLNFPSIAIANIDNTGDPEVVVVGRPKLMVFGSNGQLLSEAEFRAGDPEGRHYGALTLANVDGDSDLEAVVVADRIAPVTPEKSHALVVFDLVPKVAELWRYVAPHGDALESIPNGVADFDGDGRAEIAVNHFDGTTQAIEIYRPAKSPSSGAGPPTPIARLAGAFAWDAVDLDHDSRPEILSSVEQQRQPSLSFRSRLVISRVDPEFHIRQIGAPIDAARFATRPLRVLDRRDASSSLWADRTGVVILDRDRSPAVVTYSQSGANVRMQLRSIDGDRVATTDLGARPGAVRAVEASGPFLVAEGASEDSGDTLAFYRQESDNRHLVRIASFRASGFEDAGPVAADLDGDGRPELVVRKPARQIGVYAIDRDSGASTELWSADATTRPVVDASGSRARLASSSSHRTSAIVRCWSPGAPTDE